MIYFSAMLHRHDDCDIGMKIEKYFCTHVTNCRTSCSTFADTFTARGSTDQVAEGRISSSSLVICVAKILECANIHAGMQRLFSAATCIARYDTAENVGGMIQSARIGMSGTEFQES